MVKIIQDSKGLPTLVMNVLINYVLFKNELKLTKVYMQKLAGHWSSVKLKTASEAMRFFGN